MLLSKSRFELSQYQTDNMKVKNVRIEVLEFHNLAFLFKKKSVSNTMQLNQFSFLHINYFNRLRSYFIFIALITQSV